MYVTKEQKAVLDTMPETQRWWSYKLYDHFEKLWTDFWLKVYSGSFKDKILDFGCGPCWASFVGGFLGFAVTNLDINNEEVKVRFAPFVNLFQQSVSYWDGKSIPFKDNTFDALVSRASFMKRTGTSLSRQVVELVRVIKPGGVWYIAPVQTSIRASKTFGIKSLLKLFASKRFSIVLWDYPNEPGGCACLTKGRGLDVHRFCYISIR